MKIQSLKNKKLIISGLIIFLFFFILFFVSCNASLEEKQNDFNNRVKESRNFLFEINTISSEMFSKTVNLEKNKDIAIENGDLDKAVVDIEELIKEYSATINKLNAMSVPTDAKEIHSYFLKYITEDRKSYLYLIDAIINIDLDPKEYREIKDTADIAFLNFLKSMASMTDNLNIEAGELGLQEPFRGN